MGKKADESKDVSKRFVVFCAGAVITAIAGVGVTRLDHRDVRLSVTVKDQAQLQRLPRDKPATLTATVENSGKTAATGVKVRAGVADCGTIKKLTGSQDITCDLGDQVSDAAVPLKIEASDGSDHKADTSVEVKWATALCPSYETVIAREADGIVGRGSFEQIAARWNAAIDSMDAPGCEMEMAGYKLDPASPRGEFAGDAGIYVAAFDKTRSDVVATLKIKLSDTAIADTANIRRLLIAVAASTSADADLALPAPQTNGAPAPSTSADSRSDESVLIACGDPFKGLEVTSTTVGSTTELKVSICSTRGR